MGLRDFFISKFITGYHPVQSDYTQLFNSIYFIDEPLSGAPENNFSVSGNKTQLINTDRFIIEDSEDQNTTKYVQWSDILNSLDEVNTVVYATRYDNVGNNIAYVGESIPGALTSDPVWRIKRLDTSNNDLITTWANGNSTFNNIWDSRTILIYS